MTRTLFSLRLSSHLKKLLEEKAELDGTTITSLIHRYVQKGLKEDGVSTPDSEKKSESILKNSSFKEKEQSNKTIEWSRQNLLDIIKEAEPEVLVKLYSGLLTQSEHYPVQSSVQDKIKALQEEVHELKIIIKDKT